MAELPPSTSDEIAKAADLDERYVREVLGALDHRRHHHLRRRPRARTRCPPSTPRCSPAPRASATWPRSRSSWRCSARSSRTSSRCFREGGGVPYSKFPTFHRLMAELSKETIDATLLDGTLELVDRASRERLEAGIDVADIGCGAGYAMNVLARAFPNSRFTGFDFSEEAIAAARGAGGGVGPHQRHLRGARRRRARTHRALRPRHRLRRHPRPGRPGRGPPRHRRRAPARRRVPLRRRRGVEPPRGQPGPPARAR